MYPCNHSNDAAYGGLAILVKDNMKHLELDSYRTQHIQASCIAIKYCSTLTTVAAIYSPPKHKVTDLLQHPGQRWVAGGDWNAKHENWGSRGTAIRSDSELRGKWFSYTRCSQTHTYPKAIREAVKKRRKLTT